MTLPPGANTWNFFLYEWRVTMTFAFRASLVLVLALGFSACNQTPTEPAAVVSPAPTPTLAPASLPLATVHVTLTPASSTLRHGFRVHIEVREIRGIGISAIYWGVEAPGTSYSFPDMESGITDFRIEAGGVGTTDVLVEATEDVPCSAGLTVWVRIQSDDHLIANVPNRFNCTTGYWPL